MNGSVLLILILINEFSESLILCFVNPIKILVFVKTVKTVAVNIYDTEDSFNNMLAVNQIRLNLKCSSLETGLSLHMNIRRISNKFDKVTNFLGQLPVKIPIIYWDF